MHTHLTQKKRYHILTQLPLKKSQKSIAQDLKVHPSTLSRELKRGIFQGHYCPEKAHHWAHLRKSLAHRAPRILQGSLREKIFNLIREKHWSPEQVCGRLRAQKEPTCHFTTVYRAIHQNRHTGGMLFDALRYRGKKRRKRKIPSKKKAGPIPNRISISNRPQIVQQRSRKGDWEIDTIVGAHHSGGLLTLVDRKSRYVLIRPVKSCKSPQEIKQHLLAIFMTSRMPVHTITSDNGSEFSHHEIWAKKLGAKAYFAHPSRPCERGTNENTNGLIRCYFPKKTPLYQVTLEQTKTIQDRLNFRPRKCLNFRTPHEVMFENLQVP